jgi:hypothetical protein
MSSRRVFSPGTLALGEALDHSIPLGVLLARVQASRQRFECLRPLLPAELAAVVRPGPLDDKGWTLLADSNAAAAKLRQSLPTFRDALLAAGLAVAELRVKVQPRGSSA